MVNDEILEKLFRAFPHSLINRSLEFVADYNPRVNSYFCLKGIKSEIQVQCKVMEWLSRDGCYSLHYYRSHDNERVHKYHRNGINDFLGTNFSHEDIELIYQKLGNGVNRELSIQFIESGFDLEVLKEKCTPTLIKMKKPENG